MMISILFDLRFKICCANQLTGFYMRVTLAFNGLNLSF